MPPGFRIEFLESLDGTRLRAAVWYPVRGASTRGICVVLGGHSEFLEKYEEVFGELAERGFAGASLDWRGQGGSRRLLADPLKAHVRDFSEYDDDLSCFIDRVVRPMSARRPIALAHSMGAHILLRALHAQPDLFAAAVLTAPMLRTYVRGLPRWFVRAVCTALNRAGQSDEWVWGTKRQDPLRALFRKNIVTSDPNRFDRNLSYLRERPELRLAGPTWAWLEAAFRSMNQVMAPGFAEEISTPCLLVGAGHDRIVTTETVRTFAERLPRGTYVEIANAEHEILMENDAIREQFWQTFDWFVAHRQ